MYVTDTNEHYNEIEIEGEIPVVAPSTIKYNNIEYIISSDDAPHDPIYDLDPNMFCTFDENDDFKEISFYGKVAPGSSGNSGTIDINSATGLNYIQEISIGSCKSDITSINDSFLSGCTNLTSVDLSGFTGSVTSIGDDFLSWSTKLTSIDLSPLKDVTTIGESFIEQSALASINLSPLSNVTTIGNWFLCDCKSLTSVDCSVLTAMATTSTATIGSAFLYGCEKLTNINMGAISASKLDTGAASEGGNDYYSFAVDDTSCLAYTNGITLTGTDKTAIITAFPNRSYTAKEITDNFRKWVD